MSGKRKPLIGSPKDSSSSGDEEPISRGAAIGYQSPVSECDGASSPGGSSTASGPVYFRQPGFERHGHEVQSPSAGGRSLPTASASTSKCRKKKVLLSAVFPSSGDFLSRKPTTSGGRNRIGPTPEVTSKDSPKSTSACGPVPDVTTPVGGGPDDVTSVITGSGGATLSCSVNVPATTKVRKKRDSLPMKLRALPLSFWQEPNVASRVSPGNMYARLPPLTSKESPDGAEIELPSFKTRDDTEKDPEPEDASSQHHDGKRIVRVSNTDWLFKLFEGLEGHDRIPSIKRGRPKKAPVSVCPHPVAEDDPCMGNVVAESLWPMLPWSKKANKQATLTMVSLRDRDKSVSLPALHPDHRNYSQLLSEAVPLCDVADKFSWLAEIERCRLQQRNTRTSKNVSYRLSPSSDIDATQEETK